MDTNFTEESWELEISSALGQLGMVDPPSGAIEQAMDHRPKYSGRALLGLTGCALLAVFIAVLTGSVTHSKVSPDVDVLAEQHKAVEAGVLPGLGNFGETAPVETPLNMPDGYERTADLAGEDVVQAVYGRGDQSVSVFVQPGQANWDSLSSDGRTVIAGNEAWIDESEEIVIVQTSDAVVTVVGLSVQEVDQVLASLDTGNDTVLAKVQDLVAELAGQLGFPNLD